jgi:hypothetical protein
MGRMRAYLAVVGGVAAAVTLAACGGDSSPEQLISTPTETTADEALSKTDFIAEADQRCAEANSQIGTMVENGEGYTGAGEIADLRQNVLDQLKQLGAPDEDRATYDQFLNAFEDQVQAGQKIALAIERSEDTSQFETELSDAQATAQSAAESYGFKECGSEITASSTSTSPSTSSPDSTGAVPVTPAPSAPVTPAPSTGGGTDSGGGDSGGSGGGGGVGVP